MRSRRHFAARSALAALVLSVAIGACGGEPEPFSGVGFDTEVPDDWEPLDDDEAAEEVGLDEEPGTELVASWLLEGIDVQKGAVAVARAPVRPPGETPRGVFDFARRSLASAGAVITVDEPAELDDAPAQRFEFTIDSPTARGVRLAEAYAVEDGFVYAVSFSASSQSVFDDHEPEFEAMLDAWAWE